MKIKENSVLPIESEKNNDSEKVVQAAIAAEEKYGELLEEGKHPNPMALAYFLSLALGTIVYIGPEDRLYRRDPQSGLFCQLPEDLFSNEILDFLITFFREERGLAVCHKLNSHLAKELIRLLKRFCRDDHFFERKPGEIILHMQNCFLVKRADGKDFQQLSLATEDIHSRNQIIVLDINNIVCYIICINDRSTQCRLYMTSRVFHPDAGKHYAKTPMRHIKMA